MSTTEQFAAPVCLKCGALQADCFCPRCTHCGELLDDAGDGWDDLCAVCADRFERDDDE